MILIHLFNTCSFFGQCIISKLKHKDKNFKIRLIPPLPPKKIWGRSASPFQNQSMQHVYSVTDKIKIRQLPLKKSKMILIMNKIH